MKLVLTKLGKAEDGRDLGKMISVSVLDVSLRCLSDIHVELPKDSWIYKSGVKERSLGWRYKLGSYNIQKVFKSMRLPCKYT